ncbi:MAG TPA: hypothetical protein VN956_20555 [Pyrinomonadaceae bacterium]|nr:hypothetical protein [Pyrinomonadaceae bacterium]
MKLRSSRWHKAGIILTITGALLSHACLGGLKSLAGLNALQQRLVNKYHEDVGVQLQNSRFLIIVFNNSSLNDKDPASRQSRAQETAQFVALNYRDINQIQTIWIRFIASETRLIVFHRSRGIAAFAFDRNGKPFTGRQQMSLEPEVTDPRAPVVRFSSARDETDVSVTRLQLEGDMNHGIALVPHFVVPGDARQPGAATIPPESAVLDFASYADKPVFTDNPNLEIYCDDRLALKGYAHLLSANDAGDGGNVAQFLTVQTSFKTFRRIADSRNVRIKLGPRRFDLAPDDINALRALCAYSP